MEFHTHHHVHGGDDEKSCVSAFQDYGTSSCHHQTDQGNTPTRSPPCPPTHRNDEDVPKKSWIDNLLKKSGSILEGIKTDLTSAPSAIYIPPSVGTTSTQAATGFLKEVNSIERRGVLAVHEIFCQHIKYERFMNEYKAAEAAQSDIDKPFADHFSSQENFKKRNKRSRDLLSNTDSTYHGTNNAVKLYEPEVLRMSMYQKMTIHFQQFYNDHDVLSLSSLLIFPLCNRQVTRTTVFWDPLAWDMRNRFPIVNTRPQFSAVHRSTICGSQTMMDAIDSIFHRLPDSLMFFGDITVQEYSPYRQSSSRGVIFRAPYTYLFKVPVIATTATLSSDAFSLSSHTNPLLPVPSSSNSESSYVTQSVPQNETTHQASSTSFIVTKMVDIELQGHLEMHFSDDNIIAEIFDHSSLVSSHNSPFTSMKTLVRYMGFLG